MKAVIFDLDGVLVDSFDAWHHATNKILESIGKSISKKEYRKYWGVAFRDAARDFGITDNLEELEKRHNKIFENNLDKIKLEPYAKETVEKLKKEGKKLVIVSNSKKRVIEDILDNFGMTFDLVIGNDNFAKPSPKGIEKACEILNVDKSEAIYIGDTKTDVKTGKNAHIKTFIIGKDIDNLKEILDIVD